MFEYSWRLPKGFWFVRCRSDSIRTKDTLACAQVDEAGQLFGFDDIANTRRRDKRFLGRVQREAINTVAIGAVAVSGTTLVDIDSVWPHLQHTKPIASLT
jgi:hypothetical protein